jgi:uncharacterized protein with PQ loop repeat
VQSHTTNKSNRFDHGHAIIKLMAKHLAHHTARKHHRLTKKQKRTLLTRTVLAIAIIEPMLTIPQIYEIWVNNNAGGVSPLTWGLYTIPAIVWLMYGMQLKDKPLMISSTLWIGMELMVFTGSLMYATA